MVVMLSTHRTSRQTGETTLSTLSGETNNTTLSSNTRGSGGSRSTLHRTKEQITSVYPRQPKTLTEQLKNHSGHSQGNHQNREIPSLHRVLGLQRHQPHQGDQRDRSHHGLLLLHLCRQVRRVQVVH